MHGSRGGEDPIWRRRRHMCPVPDPATSSAPTTVGTTSPIPTTSLSSSPSGPGIEPDAGDVSFLKDGREIHVGDCALFKAGNAPPFIGIIRSFTTCKEDFLKLCVNWLYRPADVKVAKGILLEAAPNEVFYSFHKDVISAASLLHPCKVAFLRKGVELPSGISSFLCRRVYDITNECLWWLTDKDYMSERQEEVDHLLDRTRVEMHAAVQSEGRSPKPLNAPTSTQQVQNSGTSFPSQTKGKKRGRGELSAESTKRERPTRTEDVDHASYRLDTMIKTEIAKITKNGALITIEGVEKFVRLMQLGNERKIDLAGRVLLTDVIAATDKIECLGRYVQLKGLSILDGWLQEAHKGKAGDGSSPKESDKGMEELLLALLRAFDKLPVNLTALQTCNIGKSVNNLRSHKNLDIQKKARSLVDTWKKRVDAEITKNSDVKSGGSNYVVTWPVKPGFSEAPPLGNRWAGTEPASRSAVTQPSACKTSGSKPGHADATMKPTITPGSVKLASSLPSAAVCSKESPSRGSGSSGTSELPLATVKEEKSSSSSQSQNNSQSCSSDHAKTMGPSWKEDARSSTAGSMNASNTSGGSSRHHRSKSCSSDHAKTMGPSWKEDARSSTAGSMNASNTSGGSSRHHRSSNGLPGSSNSVFHKGTNMGKSSSVTRSTPVDKLSTQSVLSFERSLDMPGVDHGNGHRLIIRLPNLGRSPARCSPARSTSGGSMEEASITGSRSSFPADPDKFDNVDRKAKVGVDACRSHISTEMNAGSCPSNGVKEGLAVSDEGDRSLTATMDEKCKSVDEAERTKDVSRAACSSSGNEKGGSLKPKTKNSFSSMNALAESCAKYSEASSSLPAGDDIGMNLLASVATGEMSKSSMVFPSTSPGTSPVKEGLCAGNNDAKSVYHEDGVAHGCRQSDENTDINSAKHGKVAVSVSSSQELQQMSIHSSLDSKSIAPLLKNKLSSQPAAHHPNSSVNLYKVTEISMVDEMQCDNHAYTGILANTNKGLVVGGICQSAIDEDKSVGSTREKIVEGGTKNSEFVCNLLVDGSDNDIAASGRNSEKSTVEESLACAPSDQVQSIATLVDKQPPAGNHVEALDGAGDDVVASPTNGTIPSRKAVDEFKSKKCDESEDSHLAAEDRGTREIGIKLPSSIDDNHAASAALLGTSNQDDGVLESKQAMEHRPVGTTIHEETPTIPVCESDISSKLTGSRLSGAVADRRDELVTSTEASSFIITSQADIGARLDFDLNEGIPGDDVNQNESVISATPFCSPAVRLSSLVSFVSGSLTGPPVPITVAAPAKGPFIPPENLLKNEGEPGWKGSAATSAFRPAEPQKILEMPLNTDVRSSDTATGKQGRPLLDIDLNVPDEGVLEDMAFQNSPQTTGSESGVISNRDASIRSGGLDLDLNRLDEGMENGQFPATTSNRLNVPVWPFSGGFSNGDAYLFRDFDLNNGPGMDESSVEPAPKSQYAKSSNGVPFLPPIAGLRMGNTEIGNVSSWFPQGNSYPAVAIPSVLHDRREQPYPIVAAAGPQRALGSISGGSTFGGDVYRGPVLSSSPAMAFSPASAFPYAGFSFGPSFPVTSTSFPGVSTTYVDLSTEAASCFPAIPSQYVGTAGGVSSHYTRPYVVSLPEGSSSTVPESSRKWGRQGLDLNSGPGTADIEVKDVRLPSASRGQLPMPSSQAFVEEQVGMWKVVG